MTPQEKQNKKDIEEIQKMYKESQDQIWATWEALYGWKRPEDKKETKKKK